ncbi:maker721 [Drosophila busckii]|uniref:Maker721 n=1 Tax=Drosophila busckii TaxID=30019 RepID=A0A0M4EQ87_DROBS|nr:uncharacterized protein LOC108599869 [Drosophila busckii]ALC44392.1 maker721 [Drosophila busckii]
MFYWIFALCLALQTSAQDICTLQTWAPSCPWSPPPQLINLQTPEAINFIINYHDSRNPKRGIIWDPQLATSAVKNVRQCRVATDRCTPLGNYWTLSQKVASYSYRGFEPKLDHVLGESMKTFFNKTIANGAPTQMRTFSVARTGVANDPYFNQKQELIGCAAARYMTNGNMNFLLCCNYATVMKDAMGPGQGPPTPGLSWDSQG